MTDQEVWKPVNGYEGRYEVSSKGRVKGLYRGTRLLKPGTEAGGYLFVVLSKENTQTCFKVHRLVADAFVATRNGNQVNHIDGNRQNNDFTNLEWCTGKQNTRHAWSMGLSKCKLKRSDMAPIRRLLKGGMTQRAVAAQYGVSQSRISYLKTKPTQYAN